MCSQTALPNMTLRSQTENPPSPLHAEAAQEGSSNRSNHLPEVPAASSPGSALLRPKSPQIFQTRLIFGTAHNQVKADDVLIDNPHLCDCGRR
jgi:hypothetical protein